MDGNIRKCLLSIRDVRLTSDGRLLHLMSCQGDHIGKSVSTAAGLEFQLRHGPHLHAQCQQICHFFAFPQENASELVSLTLQRAIRKYHTFKETDGSLAASQRTRAWLARIAYNIAVDAKRNPKRPNSLMGATHLAAPDDYTDEDIAIFHCDRNKLPRDHQTVRAVLNALSKLDERTKAVLAYTALEARRSPGRAYMYRGSLASLAKRWNTSTANIRKIRRRGMHFIADIIKNYQRI